MGCAHNYASSSSAKAAVASIGYEIQLGMLSEVVSPMVFTFTGAGNVSQVLPTWYNLTYHSKANFYIVKVKVNQDPYKSGPLQSTSDN